MVQRATIDAEDNPELQRIVREVRERQEPVVIQEAGEDVAMVVPLATDEPDINFKPTQEQIDAVLSAFGAWKGLIDPDELKAQIKAARGSNRPTYKL